MPHPPMSKSLRPFCRRQAFAPVAWRRELYHIPPRRRNLGATHNDRAHDLIDLQLINLHSTLDLAEVKATCERLFTYRREQAWPPKLVKGPNWSAVYKDARDTLRTHSSIFKTVDEAIRWTNDLIKKIDAVESKRISEPRSDQSDWRGGCRGRATHQERVWWKPRVRPRWWS